MSPEPGISIVVTVKNEEENIAKFLESLKAQEMPFEVIVVDSESIDRTREIVLGYGEYIPLNYIRINCSRGKGRNIGSMEAKFPYLLFLDGDCTADANLLHNLRKLILKGPDIIAGKTTLIGPGKYSTLKRVTLFVNGFEVTSPSSNLCYRRSKFKELGGFNESMVTAEDIDLNIRAIRSGAVAVSCEECNVNAFTRESSWSFMRQGFWNGYGRGQLRLIHSKDWSGIIKGQIVGNSWTAANFLRLLSGFTGYVYALLKRGKYPRKIRSDNPS